MRPQCWFLACGMFRIDRIQCDAISAVTLSERGLPGVPIFRSHPDLYGRLPLARRDLVRLVERVQFYIRPSVMGRLPSSSFFNRRSSRHDRSFAKPRCLRLVVSPQAWWRSSRCHRGSGSGLADCNTFLVVRRNHDPACVLRQALASVRGQRGGCQLHAFRNGAVPVKSSSLLVSTERAPWMSSVRR